MRCMGSRVETMNFNRWMAWPRRLCVCARTPLIPPVGAHTHPGGRV